MVSALTMLRVRHVRRFVPLRGPVPTARPQGSALCASPQAGRHVRSRAPPSRGDPQRPRATARETRGRHPGGDGGGAGHGAPLGTPPAVRQRSTPAYQTFVTQAISALVIEGTTDLRGLPETLADVEELVGITPTTIGLHVVGDPRLLALPH